MHKNIRLLYVHNFLNDFRFQEAFAVIYFSQIGGSYTIAMGVIATSMIVSALLDIVTGIISDRLGRKITIVIGSVCATLEVTCYAFANGPILLFAGAFFSGLTMALFSGNNTALLYETLKSSTMEDKFARFLGKTSSMFQLALAISALFSSLLVTHGLRFVFMVGIIPQALSAIISLFFTEPILHTRSDRSRLQHFRIALLSLRRNPRLCLLTIAQAISFGTGEAGFKFNNAYMATLCSFSAVGLYRAIQHGMGFVGYWFAGRILTRISNTTVMLFDQVFNFFAHALGIALNNVLTPALLICVSISFGPYRVARDHLFHEEFTDEERATMSSIASFSGSIVFALMAILMGGVADSFGPRIALAVSVVVGATSLPLYLTLFRKNMYKPTP